MKSKNVSMRVFFVFVIFELLSACSRPQQPSDTKAEPVRQQQPVLNSNSDTVLKYKEIEADAIINNSKWKPLTGNVNVSVTQDHKSTTQLCSLMVSIMLFLLITEETTSKVNTGDFFNHLFWMQRAFHIVLTDIFSLPDLIQ